MRYYYKNKNNTGYLNLKSPLQKKMDEEGNPILSKGLPIFLDDDGNDTDYIEMSEQEWNAREAQLQAEAEAAEAARLAEYNSPANVAKREKEARIAFLKGELARTDYQAIKFAEGWITAEEYAEMKAQRQAWRDEINQLEAQLA